MNLSVDSLYNINPNIHSSQEQLIHHGKRNSVSSGRKPFSPPYIEENAGTLYFEDTVQLPSIESLKVNSKRRDKRMRNYKMNESVDLI